MTISEICLIIIAIFTFIDWYDTSPFTKNCRIKYGIYKYKLIKWFKGTK